MLTGKKLWLTFIVIVIASVLLLQPVLAEESPAKVEEVELIADPPDWGLSGHDLIFTAQVIDGTEDAEFAFYYKLPGGKWTLARPYSTVPTWEVSTNYVGEVEIGVIARAVGSDAFDEARDTIDYRLYAVEPVYEVGLRANPPGRQAPGEKITFTAEVWDGNENAEFAFYYKLPGGKWTLARPYSTVPTWEVSTNYVGKVEIGVIARAVGSDAFDEARRAIGYSITDEAQYTANVSGRAVDVETGEAVAGADVDFWNLHGHYEAGYVQTDSDGYFSLDVPAEPGKNDYHIWFNREGYILFALEVTITEDVIFDPVDFYPEDMSATVTGRVTDADSGALLDDVWVDARLTGTDYFFNYDPHHREVEGDGNYQLLIPEGLYNINFHREDYTDHRETVSVEAGEILNLNVELTPYTPMPHFSVHLRYNVSVKLYPPELEMGNASTFSFRHEAGKFSDQGSNSSRAS